MTQLREWGVPEDQINDVARFGQDRAAPPVIWPENADAFRWFLAVQTQWRMAVGFGTAMVLGLDYAGAGEAARLARIRTTPRMFDDLRLMEAEARKLMNERRDG